MEYGIRLRSHVSNGTKRRDLDEAIKFTSAYADRGDRVRIKVSWAACWLAVASLAHVAETVHPADILAASADLDCLD